MALVLSRLDSRAFSKGLEIQPNANVLAIGG